MLSRMEGLPNLQNNAADRAGVVTRRPGGDQVECPHLKFVAGHVPSVRPVDPLVQEIVRHCQDNFFMVNHRESPFLGQNEILYDDPFEGD